MDQVSRLPFGATWLLLASVCFALPACAKRSGTLEVSPPLPPAEEPSDAVKSAFASDAGTPRR